MLNPVDIPAEEQKIIDGNVARLMQGVEVWNNWRTIPDPINPFKYKKANLKGADLRDTKLLGVNLSGADLNGANLVRADLESADLSFANLSEAHLNEAKLIGANFIGAFLRNASLSDADLNNAQLFGANLCSAHLINTNFSQADLREVYLNDAALIGANFKGADLESADLSGAILNNADFSDSILTGLNWNPKKMRGKFQGIRGLDSSYGNALFKRAAADQDYLDSLEAHWKRNRWKTFLFKLWGVIDYGRSIGRVIAIAFITIFLFGLTYSIFPCLLGLDCVPNTEGCNRHSWFTPFYFSIVTFTTLGYGDITPKNLAGELVVSLEVVLGYLVLGLLISVLADKVVRRS